LDADKICQAFCRILPDAVCISAGPALSLQLTKRERLSLGIIDEPRLREFASGRAYAKEALAMLGVHNVELPLGPNRLPIWPSGVTGSITHARIDGYKSYAAAAVAYTSSIAAIGIDLENEPIFPDIWHYVLTERELLRILALPVQERCTEVQRIWCAKEAAIKAVGRPFDPLSFEINHDPTSGDFLAELSIGKNRVPYSLPGRTTSFDGLMMAAVARG
jgi:4'-phosphopantetheinyl transferase EntD